MQKIYQFYALSASNDPNNYRYIGVTSLTIKQRFYQHKYNAMHEHKRGLPVHKWMWSVYQNNLEIIYTKIGECFADEWEEKEKSLIKQYKEKYNLLNIDKGGSGVITAEKRSKSSILRSIEGHQKKIVAFTKDGILIDIYDSATIAAQKLNILKTAIGNVLKNRVAYANGIHFIYYKDYINPDFNIHSRLNELNLSLTHKRSIYQFTLNGELIERFDNLTQVGKILHIDKSDLSKALKQCKVYKGCYWAHVNKIDINEFSKETYVRKQNKLY